MVVRGVTRYSIPFYLYPTLSMNGFSALPACECVCVRVFISILDVDESLWRYTLEYTFYRSHFILLIFFVAAEIFFHQKCTLALYMAWLTELNTEQHCFLLCRHYQFPFACNDAVAGCYCHCCCCSSLHFHLLRTFDYMQILLNDFDSWLRQWLLL